MESPHPTSAERLAAIRSGKLRWLQGGLQDSLQWNAFEAPHGMSFTDWVQSRGAVSWSDLREVLLALVQEFQARLKEEEHAIETSLRHLWIDAGGKPKLLDFPATVDNAGAMPPTLVDESTAKLFIQQVLRFALTPHATQVGAAVGEIPSVPLPEHVRRFVFRV